MSDGVTFDTSEVAALAVDLGKAGRKATLAATQVILKAALNIEKGMRSDFSGSAHAPLAPLAIDHTVRGLSAEVGFNKQRPQGALGNILAYGTSKNAAIADVTASLRREIPAVEKYLGDIGASSL